MKRAATLAFLMLMAVVQAQSFASPIEQPLTATDLQAGDAFGAWVAIEGTTATISSPNEDPSGISNAGAVYVFTRDGLTWTEAAKLTASDKAADDALFRAAISGNTIAAGARLDDRPSLTDAGAVYVFTGSGASWTQQAKVVASDAAPGDQFGVSVALEEDTLVVGSFLDDVATGVDHGSVYVFTRSGSTWTQQVRLTGTTPQISASFGASVALQSGTILAGVPFRDGVGADSGAVYVFTGSGASWTQQAVLTPSDSVANQEFGTCVALDDNTAVIGAPGPTASSPGAAYVFTRSGSTWTQQAKLTPDDGAIGDFFGCTAAIFDNTVVLGSAQSDPGALSNAGSAYVFTRSDSTWIQLAKLTPSTPEASAFFGAALALESDVTIIGAPGQDLSGVDSGAAYAFFPGDPNEETEPPFEPRPIEPGGIFGDNGAIFGGNKTALAATMEISVAALEIGMAILWILLFTAIGYLAFNRSMAGALAGGVGGVVWSIAWGLIPIWFVFMLIVLTGAGLLLLRRPT